jgi:uncharacterized protein (TIRG00374 family)
MVFVANRKGRKILQKSSVYRFLSAKLSNAMKDFLFVYATIIKKGKIRFIICVLLGAIGLMSRLFVVAFLVMSMGMEADIMRFAALQWIILYAAVVMPTPGAAVGAEAMFFMLFKPYIAGDALGVVTAGWRFLTFYLVNIVAAVIFLITSFDLVKLRKKPCSVKVEVSEK